MANLLQLLGIQSPGIGVVPNTDYSDGGYASPVPNAGLSDSAPITQPQTAANLLQALNIGAPADAAPAVQPVDAGTQPARSRSSILDKIGRFADAIATIGGSAPLYQPTLDARQDRQIALGDHDRAVAMDKIKLANAQGDLGDANNVRLGNAIRGLQAITSANPQADVSKIWPILAAQAGLDPQRAQELGAQFAANPDLIKGIAGFTSGADKYSGALVTAIGPDGKLHAFQPSTGSADARDVLPQGYYVVDPAMLANLGGQTAVLGKNTGDVKTTLTNTVKPDTVANNQTQRDIANAGNQTKIAVANINANRPGKGGKAATDQYSPIANGINSMRSLDQSLGDLVNDPNLAGATGLIGGNLNITSGQRAIRGKIASLEGQGIPAAIAAIKAAGGASPRAVSEIMGEVKGLIGAIHNRDMDTQDYVANINAARGRLKDRIRELTSDAVSRGIATLGPDGQLRPAAPAPSAPTRTLPPRLGTKPSRAAPKSSGNGGWKILGTR